MDVSKRVLRWSCSSLPRVSDVSESLSTPCLVFLFQPHQEPKPGDLIRQIFHTGYEHWAIYVGGGYVIHLYILRESPRAGSSKIFLFPRERTVVQQEHMEDVFGGCRYQVNNYLDHEYRLQSVGDVTSSVKEKAGQKEYILDRNHAKDPKYPTLRGRNCDWERFFNHLDSR
nr:LOW QUALITY PROTEIN: retinoic acid receptor responder protein 3-like [Loxodonta africana]